MTEENLAALVKREAAIINEQSGPIQHLKVPVEVTKAIPRSAV